MFLRLFALTCLAVCLICCPCFAQWTTYQGDAAHDGYVPISLSSSALSLLWQRSLSSYLSPVTAANGEVFASTSTGLQALDAATGQTKWSKSFTAANPPAYGNGVVYVQVGKDSGSYAYLWAYNANTGAQLFSSPFGAQWEDYYAPTIYDNAVYIDGGYYGGMYAFDGFGGQQKWFVSLNQYDEWTPAVDANYAYAYTGDYSPSLTAISRSTGQVAFQISDPSFDWNGWSMYEAPALGTHNDAFGINANRLICFDLQNKSIKWQVSRSFGGNGQATVAKGVVYAIDGGMLDAIDELTGNLLWSWTSPSGSLTGTVIATNTHVLTSNSTATYAVSLTSHAATWSYPVGGALALSDRALYIANSSGTLTALAVPLSSVYPVSPSSLSISVSNPTGNPYLTTSNSITLSGTANELNSSGGVKGTGNLASIAWSNNRGGAGGGFFDSVWNMPTAWSTTGIALQPGDNVITVTATDLWGNVGTASVTVSTPTGLSLAMSSPTNQPTYSSNATPIGLSGTASQSYPSGAVSASAGLASITWSNDRGGSGTGTFSGPSTTPTTWSVAAVALKPGDNVITVTGTDLWGDTGSAVITITAPSGLSVAITNPTVQPTYSTAGSPVALSGTANGVGQSGIALPNASLASLKWSNNRGGSGSGTFSNSSTTPTTWSIASVALQGGDNVITVTATDLWGSTATASITVTWAPASIGAAKKLTTGTQVYIQNTTVTATNIVSGSVFVESADRTSGIRLVTNQALNVGDLVSFSGAVSRVNGEYQIGSASFASISSGIPLAPLYFNSYCIGNDRTESLNYVGLNTTGLLVKLGGEVTGTISSQSIFSIDDGAMYQDGILPICGIRIHVPSGVALPKVGKWACVTGVSRVEKITLTEWGQVNGDWYPSGTALYVPSIWIRGVGDIDTTSIPVHWR